MYGCLRVKIFTSEIHSFQGTKWDNLMLKHKKTSSWLKKYQTHLKEKKKTVNIFKFREELKLIVNFLCSQVFPNLEELTLSGKGTIII